MQKNGINPTKHLTNTLCKAYLFLTISKFFSIISFLPFIAFAQVAEFTVPHTYMASRDQTFNDARAAAMQEAQTALLQQLGVLVEARQNLVRREVNGISQEDFMEEAKTYTLGRVQTRVVNNTENFAVNSDGAMVFSATFQMTVDTADLFRHLNGILVQRQQARADSITRVQRISHIEQVVRTTRQNLEQEQERERPLRMERDQKERELQEATRQRNSAQLAFDNARNANDAHSTLGMRRVENERDIFQEAIAYYNRKTTEFRVADENWSNANRRVETARINLRNAEDNLARETGIEISTPMINIVSYDREQTNDDTISQKPIDWNAMEISISTESQLREFARVVNSGEQNFEMQTIVLVNNIDIADGGWVSIGRREREFRGIFDGNNKSITGVLISSSDSSNQGLFGASSGTIKNLTVRVNIRGSDFVGGLVGINSGIIKNVGILGNVSGNRHVGGLVGYMSRGEITHSFFIGELKGANMVGGIVGQMWNSVIEECFAILNATGTGSHVGGLTGWATASTITNSFVRGNIFGGSQTGALTGSIGAGLATVRIVNCYAVSNRRNLSGSSFAGSHIINSHTLGKGRRRHLSIINYGRISRTSGIRSIEQMKQQSTFAGWNFDNTWGILSDINGGFPYLRVLRFR